MKKRRNTLTINIAVAGKGGTGKTLPAWIRYLLKNLAPSVDATLTQPGGEPGLEVRTVGDAHSFHDDKIKIPRA
jgi:hypothetical protein